MKRTSLVRPADGRIEERPRRTWLGTSSDDRLVLESLSGAVDEISDRSHPLLQTISYIYTHDSTVKLLGGVLSSAQLQAIENDPERYYPPSVDNDVRIAAMCALIVREINLPPLYDSQV